MAGAANFVVNVALRAVMFSLLIRSLRRAKATPVQPPVGEPS